MSALLDAQDLADLIKCSKETIITTLSRSPEKLPPKLAGFPLRGPRWRQSDVDEWIDSLAVEPVRRGRPRTQASGTPQL